MYGQARCRNWTPLSTQQLRLRHLVRILGYNVSSSSLTNKGAYYTLHIATMCSPFYTSEKINSDNPKWKELDLADEIGHNSGVVVRIWLTGEKSDKIVCVWGVYFSGLVYLGNKIQDISPIYFEKNTLIFQFIGGYFTSHKYIKYNSDNDKPLPFINNLNVNETDIRNVTRNLSLTFPKYEIRSSYNIDKLQRLHSLQLSIRNRCLDNKELREKICDKCPMFDKNIAPETEKKNVKENINSLTISIASLNKLLNQQPTRHERQEAWKLKKLIETARFNCKLLSQEKDRKTAFLRQLTQSYNKLSDTNDYNSSVLMDRYRQLSRDLEKIREWRKNFVDTRDAYLHASVYLNLRRKQLMSELLDIYPIEKFGDKMYKICDVYLPDSESLSENDDTAISVALGYVTHAVQMCSIFLHIPLRYPVHHYGSRSKIYDYVSDKIPEKDREFPLYSPVKDQRYFHYAIYLLNKNIAQLRWYCGLPTQDLRATLANLLTLLQFRTEYGSKDSETDNLPAAIRPSSSNWSRSETPSKKSDTNSKAVKSSRTIPGNSSSSSPSKSLLGSRIANVNRQEQKPDRKERRKSDRQLINYHYTDGNIEQGLDLLDPRASLLLCDYEHSTNRNESTPIASNMSIKMRATRSVGSYNDDKIKPIKYDVSPSSEPLLLNKMKNNHSAETTLPNSLQEEKTEFLQEWLNSGPALVCSEENLYPEEILGTAISQNYPDDQIDIEHESYLN